MAYAVLLVGLLVVCAAALVLVLWFASYSSWERRGIYSVISIGVAIVVYATRLFDALPDD